MTFKKNKYKIVKQIISKQLSSFISHYFLKKMRVAQYLFDHRYISPFTTYWGVWNDTQAPNTYSHYADVVFENLLEGLTEKIEKECGYKLYPTYSYARIYKKGDTLTRHKDRKSCELSGTLHIGGDKKWSIYYDPSGSRGQSGVKIDLNPGDLLLYNGDNEHWRTSYKGKYYCQAFLHYNKKNKKNISLKFDGRPFLGLPVWFKGFTLPKK